MRSLGWNVRKDKADVRSQFQIAADDVNWELLINAFGGEYHSSILRLSSGGVGIWTHYDVMNNVLCQISGERFVTLYSPNDCNNAYLKGDKSLVIDPNDYDPEHFPLFQNIQLYKCKLNPGDVLFIPALWFHHISMGTDPSVAINIFWKSPLKPNQYNPNDLYGNKDPQPAEQALKLSEKIIKLLNQMPEDHADFYGKRICANILSREVNKK